MTVADILKAAKTVRQPERVFEVPKIGTLTKRVKELKKAEQLLAENPDDLSLLREVAELRQKVGWIKHRLKVGEPITVPHNVTKALRQDALSDLHELRDAIRGRRVSRPGQTPRFEGGLIEKVRRDLVNAKKMAALAAEKAKKIDPTEEGKVIAPAFEGKVFSKKVADELREAIDPKFSEALASINKFNAVSRYFMLAADVSPMMIHLLFLAGSSPKVSLQAGAGFLRAVRDPLFLKRYMNNPENIAIIQKYPELVLTRGGATEATEATRAGGVLDPTRRILPADESTMKRTALVAPRTASRVSAEIIKPFAHGYESALDIAGLELLKSLDHMGTTAARRSDIVQYVNKFRGVTSSARLGTTAIQRQRETALLLAPQYTRAITSLLADLVHGGLSGQLARRNLGRGLAAVVLTSMAIDWIMGERDPKRILRHLNPADPEAWTWKIGNQNIGPGTKVRSILQLFGKSAANPEKLKDLSVGWGELEYMKNPLIKFGRGMSSPAVSLPWDLLTGKDYIGEPTRENLLQFTETISKRFMYIWLQTALFEGGTTIDRASRGLSEFAGLRAYPRSRIFEAADLWKPEITLYLDIPTDTLERIKQGSMSRAKYRQYNPEIDAKLWILGRVTTMKTSQAFNIALKLIREQGIDPKQIKGFKKFRDSEKLMAESGIHIPLTMQKRRMRRLIRSLSTTQGTGND